MMPCEMALKEKQERYDKKQYHTGVYTIVSIQGILITEAKEYKSKYFGIKTRHKIKVYI